MPTKSRELEHRIVASKDSEDAAVRLALAQVYCDITRLARDRLPGSNPTDIFVFSAVGVGTWQGRPMNALKIAHYTGLPHQTVGRRLNSLIRRGYVAKKGNAFIAYRLAPFSAAHTKRLIAILEPAVQTFIVHLGQFRKSEIRG